MYDVWSNKGTSMKWPRYEVGGIDMGWFSSYIEHGGIILCYLSLLYLVRARLVTADHVNALLL